VAPYRQLVDQVAHAIRLGTFRPGDRLPSVREVVSQITINPNTVHRAYRELENAGLVEGRAGLGTFVVDSDVQSTTPRRAAALLDELRQWVRKAERAGMNGDGMRGLLAEVLHDLESRAGR
jgi:GntR family transcriptional regulator